MPAVGETFRHTTDDGVELVGTAWRVPAPRATVVLAHGVNEHIGRYGEVVRRLTDARFSVVAHDHRGHGRSGGRRGWIDDFDAYVRDLVGLIEREGARSPDLPLVLLGHSMGGLIATRAALQAQERLSALVLSAPALRIGAGLPAWQRRLFLLLGRYLGHLRTPAGPPGVLSRDPTIEEQVAADPLNNLDRTSFRLARQIYLAGQDARRRAPELTIPLLVLHGSADTVTDPGGSEELVERAASADKELKLWPDNRHELFNDLDKEEVFAVLLTWLEERFPEAR